MNPKLTQAYRSCLDILWALAVIGLPLTSFPGIIRYTHTMIAPFSILPIGLLAGIWLLPYLLRGGRLPRESKFLFILGLVAIISSAGAYFIALPDFRQAAIFPQELEGLLTLGVGIICYLVFSIFARDQKRLKMTLRWINLGGALLLIFSGVQAWVILSDSSAYPGWYLTVQDWLVFKSAGIRSNVDRLSGLAFEPSWFAHQMILVYLPYWLAATIRRSSVHRFKLLGLSIENILLAVGVLEFMLSSPRVSLLGLVLIFLYLAVKVNLWLVGKLSQRVFARKLQSGSLPPRALQSGLKILISLALILIYLVALWGLLATASSLDYRLAFLLQEPPSLAEIGEILIIDESAWLTISWRLAFFERTAYWMTGLRVFNLYPWLGVGLGNTGFFIQEQISSLGWASYEVRKLIFQQDSLMNPKSMWVRLLSETGLVGFAIFAIWIYLLWRLATLATRDQRLAAPALAGQFFILAYLAEGFSIDSFILPYLWFGAGLISAISYLQRQPDRVAETPDRG